MKNYGSNQYLDGEDINNNVWQRAYLDELGIKVTYAWAVPGDEFKQKLTMAIASDDLPDLMYLPAKEFYQLAKAGKLADLTGVYEKYASELLKQNLNADGGTQFKVGDVDGKLYGAPQPQQVDGTADLIWVRQDWMEKLKLKQPKSIEDVINMARAFANDDPDGNGVKDTYGIGFQKNITDEGGSYNCSFEGFFAGFDAYSRAWLKGGDGKIEYAGIRPGMKEALATLSSMFKEGLIDPEFGVKSSEKVGEDIASGKVGLFYGREGLPWNDCKNNIISNPSAEWVCYPIVAKGGGDAKPATYLNMSVFLAANAKCKNPEAIFKLADFFQEKINSLDSDMETLNTYGIDPETGINFASYNAFGVDPANKHNVYVEEIKGVFDGKLKADEIHPEATRYYNVMKEYVDSGFDKAKYANGWNYYKFIGPDGAWDVITNYYKDKGLLNPSLFFGTPTATMALKGATLDKLQAENASKLSTGSEPVDSFDAFVEDWKSLGGDEVTKEVSDWYASMFQ